jgi:hypothetical protein
LGAAPNPGGGGISEFNDTSPVPNKKHSQKSKTFDHDYRSSEKKKKINQRINVQLMDKIKLVSMNYQIVPSLHVI